MNCRIGYLTGIAESNKESTSFTSLLFEFETSREESL